MSHDTTSTPYVPFIESDAASWPTGQVPRQRAVQAQTWYELLTRRLVQENQSNRSGAGSSEAR